MTQVGLNYLNYEETKRNNLAQIAELERANRAKEAETIRHNMAVESKDMQALKETMRSNLAHEYETKRSNVANERERHRANVASEAIGYANLDEAGRHNVAVEQADLERINVSRANVNETKRHNLVDEANRRIELDLRKWDTAGEFIRDASIGLKNLSDLVPLKSLISGEYFTN